MPEILDKYGLSNFAGMVSRPALSTPEPEEPSVLDKYGLSHLKKVGRDVLQQIPAGLGRGIVELGSFASTPIMEAEKLVRTKLLGQAPEYVEEGQRLAKEELLDLFPKPETLPGEAVGGLAEFIPSAVSFGGPAKAGIKAIAPRVAKTLPRVAKALEATVPSASAFGGAEAVSDKDLLTRGEITPMEYLGRISIGTGLGAALGGIGKLPVREALKFPVEAGAFAEASALERGEVTPTKEEAIYSLIFLGGLKGLQAGIARIAGNTGKSVEEIKQEVEREVSNTGKSEEQVVMDKITKSEGGEPVAVPQEAQRQEVLRPTTPIQPETPPPPSALGMEPQPGTTELPGATPKVEPKGYGATALPRGEGVTPPPKIETPAEKLQRDLQEEMERNLQHFRETQGEMDAQTGEGIKRIAKETVAESIAREAGVEPPPKGPTIGWSKTDVMAELLSEKSPERFAKRIGEGKGTAEVTKAFDNFVKSASVTKNIVDNLKKAPDGKYSSVDIKKVRDVTTDGLLGAYEPVSKISSESGRMLQKIQKFKINAEQLERAFGDIPPNDIAKWTEVIDRLKAIDIENNPQAFARFVKSIPNPKFMDYIYEYWYNSILSGPPTHAVNSINNAIWQAYQVPHKAVRGIVDKSLSVITGRPREYYATEAWIATKVGIRQGIGRLAEMIKTRKFPTEYSKWEREIGPSIGAFERSPSRLLRGLAPVVTLPTKALRAEDIYFRSIAYDTEIASQAYKLARKGPKEKFAERMAELLQNPTGEMIEKAGKYADYSVFMDAPGKITSTLLQLRDSVPGGRFVIPFVNTISNLLQRGLEMTPGVGLVLEKGKLGGPETADVITKQIMGGTLAYLATLYIDGLLTGAPPQDKAEREAFFRQGKLPWAVNINGIWYQYRRFEPFNTVLASVAELGDAWRDKGESPPEEQIVSIFTGLGKNLLDSSYLSTFADLISAIEKGDRASDSIKKMAQRQILSFSPFSSAQRSFVKAGEALEEGETKIRRPEGIMEALKAQTPGLSKEVTAKKDVFGREITLPGGAIRQALPFKASAEVPDLVESELQRLGIFPGTPGKKVSGLELSKEEYGKYVDLQGKATKILLNRAINSPNWPRLNDRARTKYIDAIIRTVRDEAGDKILEERVIKIRKTGMTPEQRKEVENLGLRRKHAPVGTRP